MSAQEIGLWAGFVLTLMVFSYILGDNFLYRLAVYAFVGLAAGFIAIVTVESVLIPWFNVTVGSQQVGLIAFGLAPVLLFVLLLFKTSARLARFGNLGIAFIIGVGAAVGLVGALTGTLLPLVGTTTAQGSDNGSSLLNGIILVVGVVSSLVYFQYLARRAPDGQTRRAPAIQAVAIVGQGFIVAALGALYAAAILTSLTIFSERVAFLIARINGG
ncbi:MAG: hypothetical protein SF029_10450 [bacterium]|nr:hypothetical protein [bacterium]